MTTFVARAAALLLIVVLAVWYAGSVPDVVPASAPADVFSAERAMKHVREIARGPHPIGSAEHRRVAEYIMTELTALGLTPEIQTATAVGTRYAVAGHVRNIVARMPGGSSPGKAVLLMAHYDGVPAAPGAGDDASGSAVLLETLRALRSGARPAHDVIALFTDGEESGLLGAAAFVREHPWARDVELTMNFEARGTHGPSLMFETGAGNLDVVRLLRRAGGARATSLSTAVYRKLPNDTDLSETARLGKPALNFGFIGGVNRYHTAQDDVAHLDPRSIQDHGESALGVLRELAADGPGALPRPATSDAVFFDLPVVGLIHYPERWALLFALLALVPVLLGIARVRRVERRWLRGLLLGIGGAIVGVALGASVGLYGAMALRALHARIGSGVPTHSGLYAAAIALLALALSASIYSLLRRWSPPLPLQLGGLLTVALLGVGTAILSPGVSFVFVWPALFVGIGLAFWDRRAPVPEVIRWTFTLLALLVMVPITYLMGVVALGLDAAGGAVIAVFTALSAWLAAHVLELWPERPWRSAGAFAIGGLALALVGAATVRTSDAHPVGSWIGYGVNVDSGNAWLGANATSRGAVAGFRRQLTSPPDRAPAWFGRYFAVQRSAPPPGPKITRAGVRVVSDSVAGDTRHLVVRVIPEPGIRMIALRADSGVVRQAAFDGRVVDTTWLRYPMRGRWGMEFYAPPDSGFALALQVTRDRPVRLYLTSHLPGIPRVPGLELPRRDAGVIPIQRGDFTLVHQVFNLGPLN